MSSSMIGLFNGGQQNDFLSYEWNADAVFDWNSIYIHIQYFI